MRVNPKFRREAIVNPDDDRLHRDRTFINRELSRLRLEKNEIQGRWVNSVEEIRCLNCGKVKSVTKIIKGMSVACDCGCLQLCLGVSEDVSRWRVMNPFNFEDKRRSQ